MICLSVLDNYYDKDLCQIFVVQVLEGDLFHPIKAIHSFKVEKSAKFECVSFQMARPCVTDFLW